MKLIDISPLLSPRIQVWPGDVSYSNKKSMRTADGDHMDLGSFSTSYHVGAHIDAPNHFLKGGGDAAGIPLDACFGPCQVIEVAAGHGTRIMPSDLTVDITAPRVLIKTGTFPSHEDWNNNFAALSRELVGHLARNGVVLVGIDTPSIDLFDDKQMHAHHAVAAHGLVNLEGIDLSAVAAGTYTLCAFPLRMQDADASPVRAILVQD